jgi:hypothetical protein
MANPDGNFVREPGTLRTETNCKSKWLFFEYSCLIYFYAKGEEKFFQPRILSHISPKGYGFMRKRLYQVPEYLGQRMQTPFSRWTWATVWLSVISIPTIVGTSTALPVHAESPLLLASNYCEGKDRDGVIYGRAKCEFPTGNRYEGELYGGRRQGKGVFTFANGARCEGQFKNDFLEGNGICVFPSGNRYEGEFRNGKRAGRGVFIYKNGSRCQGTFQNDALNGPGTCIYPTGNRYDGMFQNNQKQGRGVLTLANGIRCEGTFQDDWLNGSAVCLFPSGVRYEGEFRAGRQVGRGVYTLTNGTRMVGNWSNGRFVEAKPQPNSIQNLQLLTPASIQQPRSK